MKPIISPPVRRPEHFEPHRTIDLEHGTIPELVAARMHLTYGANFNDPGPWSAFTFESRRESR